MYTLRVINVSVTIINRVLTLDECLSITSFGVQWVCDAFKKYIGLDISDYTIKEYVNNKSEFIVYIRPEDLITLRNNKLDRLL